MNAAAVSGSTFKDTEFFYRALITLNIAFGDDCLYDCRFSVA
jgi:hypothetical protein